MLLLLLFSFGDILLNILVMISQSFNNINNNMIFQLQRDAVCNKTTRLLDLCHHSWLS